MRKRNRKLAGGSMNFGFIPSFIRHVDCIERFRERVLGLSNSVACRVRAGQPREAERCEILRPGSR